MNIPNHKMHSIMSIAESLSQGLDSFKIRQRVGYELLELLEADYYASYVWNESTRCFQESVIINMSETNIKHYENYYQFHDPITKQLQRQRKATCVSAVTPQRELIKTEFYNDFLRPDGLYHGINMYAYDDRQNIGDIRIWRGKHRDNFDEESVQLLEHIRPYFTNMMKNIITHRSLNDTIPKQVALTDTIPISQSDLASRFALTRREAQIVIEMVHGKTDHVIADELCIAYRTVRIHVQNIYKKLGVHNRSSLTYLLMST